MIQCDNCQWYKKCYSDDDICEYFTPVTEDTDEFIETGRSAFHEQWYEYTTEYDT